MSTYTLVQLYNPESSGSSGIQEYWYPYTKRAGIIDLITFSGATGTATGSEGLVPSASTGDTNKYLRGDGQWADPPTGSGGGLQYQFTLNGTTNSGSSLNGANGIYAPTASGASKNILMGGAGNVPAWYNPGTTAGLLKFNGTSWQIDSASYSTTTGTVKSVTAGFGLNTTGSTTTSDGGTITENGTIYLTKCTTQTGTKGPTSNATASYNSTFKVPYVQVDNWGRVTGSGEVLICMPTASKFTLNNNTIGSGLDLSNGGIYAPTSSGHAGTVLLGSDGNSGIPYWFDPTSIITGGTGLFKYVAGTGWTLDTSTYVSSGHFKFKAQNLGGSIAEWGSVTTGSSDDYVLFKAGPGVTFGIGNGYLAISASGGGAGSIAAGTGLSLTNSTMSLNSADSNNIGGIRINGVENTFVGDNSSGGVRAPLLKSTAAGSVNRAYVKLPIAMMSDRVETTYGAGLLKVAADADPQTGYQNTDYLTAVPVFYGTIGNLKTFKERLPIDDTYYDAYDDGDTFPGHYVNVRDVFNGIIQDEEMMHTLWWILQQWKDGFKWPWISK